MPFTFPRAPATDFKGCQTRAHGGSPFFFASRVYGEFRALCCMNREIIDHLKQAQRHVAEGRAHVDRKRRIVEELVRDGKDAGRSRNILELFEDTLEMHIEDRDRLLRALTERP